MKRSTPTPHSVDGLRAQLVERQVRIWDWEAHRARRAGTSGPCVAISRLPGSGAAAVGRRVARQLDFDFFDIELVDRIAHEGQIDRTRVARLDERMRAPYERWVRDGFKRAPYTEAQYLASLRRALSRISAVGRAVVIGRGSPFVMPPQRTLRVLLVAPIDLRIARIGDAKGLDPQAAAERVAYEDAKRLEFLGGHFGVDPADAGHYDLVVNTGTLGIRKSAQLVVQAAEDRFPELRSLGTAPRAAQSDALHAGL